MHSALKVLWKSDESLAVGSTGSLFGARKQVVEGEASVMSKSTHSFPLLSNRLLRQGDPPCDIEVSLKHSPTLLSVRLHISGDENSPSQRSHQTESMRSESGDRITSTRGS